jgi:hypothetical protein
MVFQPGAVSTSEAIEHGATVTLDAGEVWFARAIGTWREPMASRRSM